MADISSARNIQNQIRELSGTAAGDLLECDQIENDPPAEAIRKLQVQNYALSVAVKDLASAIDEIHRFLS